MPVTLINVFSVPTGQEDGFVKWWEEVKENITKQPGLSAGSFTEASNRKADSTSSMSPYGKTKSCTGKRMTRA